MLRLTDFDYNLPKELIAQHPLKKREDARLLVVDRKLGSLTHCFFRDIIDYFGKDDLLVLNDTRVLPSRLFGRRPSGGKVEVLLLKEASRMVFQAYIRPARVKVGEKIIFASGKVEATVSARNLISFDLAKKSEVYKLGVMPLPPYIKRDAQRSDNLYYQTVYARKEGAIAAPTAGLHFTRRILQAIRAKGVKTAYLTLHVGPGTFKPVRSLDLREHKIDAEQFFISAESRRMVRKAKENKSRIIATGTTSCRALESFAAGKFRGDTDLFIYPGYDFRLVDCLLTNFHLPRTTLFMLVCALAGEKLIKKAYQEAIEKKYRFYSYGDAMLII